MSRPGAMLKALIESLFKKPATINYPKSKFDMPHGYRGKLKFNPDNCIGCKLCMRDCPTGAIEIIKIGDKQFEMVIDLGRCIYCGQCVDSCLRKALEVTPDVELAEINPKNLKITIRGEPTQNTKD